jgi:hypothetical protein
VTGPTLTVLPSQNGWIPLFKSIYHTAPPKNSDKFLFFHARLWKQKKKKKKEELFWMPFHFFISFFFCCFPVVCIVVDALYVVFHTQVRPGIPPGDASENHKAKVIWFFPTSSLLFISFFFSFCSDWERRSRQKDNWTHQKVKRNTKRFATFDVNSSLE